MNKRHAEHLAYLEERLKRITFQKDILKVEEKTYCLEELITYSFGNLSLEEWLIEDNRMRRVYYQLKTGNLWYSPFKKEFFKKTDEGFSRVLSPVLNW